MAREVRMDSRGGIALVMALVALFFAGPTAAACKLTKVAEMPITAAGDLIEVKALIDDEPVELMVDTGASSSVLSPTAAQRLGLSLRDVRDRNDLAVLGRTRAQTTVVDALKLGSLVGGQRTIIVSDDYLPTVVKVAGVIGEDLLARADVELDLPHGVMRLFKTSGCGDAEMPYWATAHYSQAPLEVDADPFGGVYATVLLNGRPVLAAIDTGAPASMVRLSTADAAGAQPGGGANDRTTSAWVGAFDTVSVGDETIRNARIRLANEALYSRMTALASRDGPAARRGSGMILGLDFFRSHRVLISPDHRMMYFTYEGGPVFQADSPAGAAPPAGR
jgi:predicted aspartyl protease